MKKAKIEKYTVKCNPSSWLAKPGLVIYVENEYVRCTNDAIGLNDKELKYFSESIGRKFIYLPLFLNRCDEDIAKYIAGKRVKNSSYLLEGVPLESVLGYEVFQQIKGPSFLFTGTNDEGYCEAYTLPLTDVSTWIMKLLGRKRYMFEKQFLKEIFDIYACTHGLHQIAPYKKEPEILFREVISEETKDHSDEKQTQSTGGSRVRYSLKVDYRHICSLEEDEPKPETPSPFGDIDISDEEKMVREKAQKLIAKLLDEGLSQEAIWAFFAPERKLSTIKITERYRIILPEYDNLEIPLPAVQKAVYFLFLRHPEGINFKDMVDYRDELFNIYRKLAERGTTDKLAATVDDLVNPLSNAMNEKCSRIKNMFCYYLTENLAKHYYIAGGKGERKHIGIDHYNIKWMKEIL